MTNVIPFRRPSYPDQQEPGPLLTITIYPSRDDRDGFTWTAEGDGEPPTREELSDFLGDMFLSLNPDEPNILQRLGAFLKDLFNPES